MSTSTRHTHASLNLFARKLLCNACQCQHAAIMYYSYLYYSNYLSHLLTFAIITFSSWLIFSAQNRFFLLCTLLTLVKIIQVYPYSYSIVSIMALNTTELKNNFEFFPTTCKRLRISLQQ